MNLQIREASADDLRQVLALYAQPGFDDSQVLDIKQALAISARFARYPSYRLFVACDRQAPDRVLGSYALLVMDNLAHLGAPSAIVEDLVVDVRYRRQGIGREMISHAVAQAHEAGSYKLALSSNRHREGAHAFYESLGFERYGYSFAIDISSS